jgi:hypothetical protein
MIEHGSGIIAKMLGVLAGTALALVFNPPNSMRGFFKRSFVAIVFGLVFGPVFIWKFEMPMTGEYIVVAFAAAAFLSWSTLSVAAAAVEKIGIRKDK